MKAMPHVFLMNDGVETEAKKCKVCCLVRPLEDYGILVSSADGLQYVCKECGNARGRKYNLGRKDKIAAINAKAREKYGPEYWREHHQRLKREMVAAYGGKCECCGEDEITFLSLDHADGGGSRHRTAHGNSRIIRDLRDAGWPRVTEYGSLRLLCMNCQFGYMHGRTCPHQLKKDS